MLPMLSVLSMRTIINNKLDYSILPEHLQDDIYFEIHKMKFASTLHVLDIINKDMEGILYDFILLAIKPVENDIYEINGEFYNYIWIKYIVNNLTFFPRGFVRTKYIQEIYEIEFD